ncbi:hypothetical protein D3C84_1225120 [compost metagenome]
MNKPFRLACVTAWLLLICGCQSSSLHLPPPATACHPPPAPAAWFMEGRAANLTPRLLNELSPSPVTVTPD